MFNATWTLRRWGLLLVMACVFVVLLSSEDHNHRLVAGVALVPLAQLREFTLLKEADESVQEYIRLLKERIPAEDLAGPRSPRASIHSDPAHPPPAARVPADHSQSLIQDKTFTFSRSLE